MKNNEKIQKFVILGIVISAILFILVTSFILDNSSNTNKTDNDSKSFESASTQMGKKAEDAKNELEQNTEFETAVLVPNSDTLNTQSSKNETKNVEASNNRKEDNNNKSEKTEASETSETKPTAEQTDTVSFKAPISGKILREFAKESLVYSDTLKEWITHNGIDIKADKTSVVSSSADGKIYAIKNDPRYGLTVIINHANGYQTVYSNLLTAEFIVEGEDVHAGQSIGTVGNSASFEILDDYHLHFELLKDNEYLDPTIYINFES